MNYFKNIYLNHKSEDHKNILNDSGNFILMKFLYE